MQKTQEHAETGTDDPKRTDIMCKTQDPQLPMVNRLEQ